MRTRDAEGEAGGICPAPSGEEKRGGCGVWCLLGRRQSPRV